MLFGHVPVLIDHNAVNVLRGRGYGPRALFRRVETYFNGRVRTVGGRGHSTPERLR